MGVKLPGQLLIGLGREGHDGWLLGAHGEQGLGGTVTWWWGSSLSPQAASNQVQVRMAHEDQKAEEWGLGLPGRPLSGPGELAPRSL